MTISIWKKLNFYILLSQKKWQLLDSVEQLSFFLSFARTVSSNNKKVSSSFFEQSQFEQFTPTRWNGAQHCFFFFFLLKNCLCKISHFFRFVRKFFVAFNASVCRRRLSKKKHQIFREQFRNALKWNFSFKELDMRCSSSLESNTKNVLQKSYLHCY